MNIEGTYNKYSLTRLRNDYLYAKECSRVIVEFKADVVLSGCATPMTQNWLRKACQREGIRFVAWVQDLYGRGVRAVLSRKLGAPGDLVGRRFVQMDESLIRRSDGVVFISEGFRNDYAAVRRRSIGSWHVIENWAPFDGLPRRPRANAWREKHGLTGKRVLLYSGTLGLKHNPDLLAQLAVHFENNADVAIVVISQGPGRDYLERRKVESKLSNLHLLDFQPFEDLPDVIATGDILIAIIEKGAGSYSAPSKVLTYLCAARPLLLSVPSSNLSAQIVARNNAGIVVEPDDLKGFLAAARELVNDPDRADVLAASGHAYANRTFQIERIGNKFQEVFTQVVSESKSPGSGAAAIVNKRP